MTTATTTEAQELAEQVRYHNDKYFNENEPEISDAEFDALVDQLRILDPDNDALVEVGAELSYGRKVKHGSLMGSLAKEKTPAAVIEWMKKDPVYSNAAPGDYRVVLTPKIDGLAVRLNYVNGKLVEAATRGDGEVGQDVTDNVRAIESIPNEIDSTTLNGQKFTGEIRGEVYMKKSVWEGFGEGANPRNSASGKLMSQDPADTAAGNLNFLAYDLVIGKTPQTDDLKLQYMRKNLPRITVVDFCLVAEKDVEAILYEWENNKRPVLDYEIDGMVLAYQLIESQEDVGWNGRRPRGKMAFKFKPEQRATTLEAVDWQVGRTGKLTPVARVSPVRLAGTTVTNITLHNVKHITKELGGLCIGDSILCEKAGEIIPQVVRVMDRNNGATVRPPDHCPCCNEPAKLDENKVSLWCSNELCSAKLQARLEHYLKTLGVLGIGPGILNALISNKLVAEIHDLYYLKHHDVEVVLGGKRAAEKAIVAVLEKSEVPLWQFLAALGIHRLGKTMGKTLAKEYKTLEEVRAATVPELEVLDGIGTGIAAHISHGLIRMRHVIDELVKCLDIEEVAEATGPLVGKSFCLTGTMSRPRKAIAADIEAAGGESWSSVTKGLTYLVQADATSESSKTKKAAKFGTEVISEETLIGMMF